MLAHARAILWAQWRGQMNYYPKAGFSTVFGWVLTLLWYGLWAFGAWGVFAFFSRVNDPFAAFVALSFGLLLAVFYWQVVPVILATTGVTLEVKKLVAYPVPHAQLFLLEVLLRVSTGIEILIMTGGAALGVMRNPKLPALGVLAFVPFVIFNLLLSAGVRELLQRWFARKWLREVLVLGLVMLGALPQLMLFFRWDKQIEPYVKGAPLLIWPWTAAAELATGQALWRPLAILLAWTAAGWWFGRWQFEQGLRFDGAVEEKPQPVTDHKPSRWNAFYQWPSRLFADPLAALMEKELRVLARSPRFRLLFLMGFSFGLVIWLPLLGRGTSQGSFFRSNYLEIVAVYALLLLGEAAMWNIFGFDRSAAQAYFVMPVPLAHVFIAKNLVTLFFVALEIGMVMVVSALFRMPVSPDSVARTYAVCAVLSLFLFAGGNLSSVHNARGVDPTKSMRSSPSGRTQALLLAIYPLALAPIGLAYLAEWALESTAAFYGALGVIALIAGAFYWVALDSARDAASARRERMLEALAQGAGPVAT
jgi:ABC-2 type transport system permease protein